MTPGVVEALEVVDVEQHEAERLAGLGRLGERRHHAFVETLAIEDFGQRVEHRLAPHLVEVALQPGDVLARRFELRLELRIGFLHAARVAQHPLREVAQRRFIHIVREIAARRLQRVGIGVGRDHRGVDGLVHRLDPRRHAVGHGSDALVGVARLQKLVIEPLRQFLAGVPVAENLVDALVERRVDAGRVGIEQLIELGVGRDLPALEQIHGRVGIAQGAPEFLFRHCAPGKPDILSLPVVLRALD